MNTAKHFIIKISLTFFIFLFFSHVGYGQGFTSRDYTKKEMYITMRDGIRLFTAVYTPKDTTRDYPALVCRTTYSCHPYGEQNIPENIMYNPDLVAKGYIFVFQDVRGRWMSEGVFENTKPPYSFWDKNATDEVTDSWDTFEWLSKNLKHFNGNIGVYGNSYLGWTSLVAAVSNPPSVKAVMPMAPVTDFFFEDFNRYGLVASNYIPVINAFGIIKNKPVMLPWYKISDEFIIDKKYNLTVDYYRYFLDKFTLKSFEGNVVDKNNVFWHNLKQHRTYDTYRKKRNWLQYLKDIKATLLIAGGWNDEQNLYGIINSYKSIVKNSPKTKISLVMGPWAHSHPKVREHKYYLGDIFYGYDLSEKFQKEIQVPFFEYYLKGKGEKPDFDILLFDTGKKTWEKFAGYPDGNEKLIFYLDTSGTLKNNPNIDTSAFLQYCSDPFHPVPFIEDDHFYYMAPKKYMTADQRFLYKRPDVLTYETSPLERDITVAGTPEAEIVFETDRSDADIYVKIIDVYPDDRIPEKEDVPGVKMNGYQQLVRMGYIRARHRDSWEKPSPLQSGKKYIIKVPLLDIFHTFKKGHRIMVQIQSSSFPLFDINPQNYVYNVYEAEKSDFTKANHKIYGGSKIVLPLRN